MGYLLGLNEYLDATYNHSVFDQAGSSKQIWELHLHSKRIIEVQIMEDLKYDIKIQAANQKPEVVPKINVKLLFPAEHSKAVNALLHVDKKIKDLKLEPILAPKNRYHVKNKNLFPLMKERKVLFFTLLEGEIVRGLISDFSRYEITVKLKGGIPVTILRHGIYDLRDKKGRCFLKSSQEKHKDWQKSELFTSA